MSKENVRCRYMVEYSLFGDVFENIGFGDDIEQAFETLYRTFKIVKGMDCSEFRITDMNTKEQSLLSVSDVYDLKGLVNNK